jgi:hypothetical protein
MNFELPFQQWHFKWREGKLAAFIAAHSSIRSVDHLGELIKQIGHQTKLQNLRLHQTKCSAIIKYVIGHSLFESLKERLLDVPFSMTKISTYIIKWTITILLIPIKYSGKSPTPKKI